jgi:hypothetical protein
MSYLKELEKITTTAFFIESLKEIILSGKYRLVNHSRVGARLERKIGTQVLTFCPITVVCYERRGIYFRPGKVSGAASLVRLDYELTWKIVKVNDALKPLTVGSLPRLLANALAI